MNSRATFRKSDLEKAILVAKEMKLPISGFRISPEGEIDVRCGTTERVDEFDLTDMRR